MKVLGQTERSAEEADVCVFVEGTYPYVTGGVSSWLHQLMVNLPELTFCIFHLGSKPELGRSFRYELPSNVIEFHELFLNNAASVKTKSKSSSSPEQWKKLKTMHEMLARQDWGGAIESLKSNFTSPEANLDASALFYSEDAWRSLVERYESQSTAAP